MIVFFVILESLVIEYKDIVNVGVVIRVLEFKNVNGGLLWVWG